MVGDIERLNPAVRALKRLIAEGRLGTLLQLHFQRLGLRPRAAPDVPVVVDLGVHDLDLAAYLCGAPPEGVTALGGRAALGVPDFACLLARRGAAAVTIRLSWVTPVKLQRVNRLWNGRLCRAEPRHPGPPVVPLRRRRR
jgi:UDP-N-acetylglucosamine 3-dehydrogenase